MRYGSKPDEEHSAPFLPGNTAVLRCNVLFLQPGRKNGLRLKRTAIVNTPLVSLRARPLRTSPQRLAHRVGGEICIAD